MSVQHPEVVGGSGNLASTSYDMGYEPKKSGGARTNTARAKRVAKALEGEAKPMVATEVQTTVVKPKRKSKAKTEGFDFNDIMDGIKKTASTVSDVVKTAATVAPYVLPLVGLGKKSMGHLSEWNSFVKKIREEKGMNLNDTLKYIKSITYIRKKARLPNQLLQHLRNQEKRKKEEAQGEY